VVDEDGTVIAGAFDGERGEFVGTSRWAARNPPVHHRLAEGENTTLVCVITDARLSKLETGQVARAGAAGVCQAVQPAATSIDGDVTFCLATGAVSANPAVVGLAASAVVADAVRAGVRAASSVRGVPTGAERSASAQ
jgi:L-aminopeptidase/D-esterase-like protein